MGDRLLWDRRPAEALTLLERAVELSPRSSSIRRSYWRSTSAQTDFRADQKRALIHADTEAFLDARQHAVDARFTVASHLNGLKDTVRLGPMWDLIQHEHAGTWQAARVALPRC